MTDTLRLLCVFAHPDDESFGAGGVLARYAAEGVETYLVAATRGERGWPADPAENPGLTALGRIREGELREACAVLGVREVSFLDYVDGELDAADPAEAIGKIVAHVRRVRPQVVLTFGPDGVYGHPDHIAISQFTTAAVVCAADAAYRDPAGLPAHRVAKLYYIVESKAVVAGFTTMFTNPGMPVDGVERLPVGWDDWAITTRVPTAAYAAQAWRAIACHRTQVPSFAALAALPDEQRLALWAEHTYYRAMSTVNGGRGMEDDLFAGLRATAPAPSEHG